MAPADEGFRADQAAIRETDLRLVEQFEFIPLDGAGQFRLQRQARFKFLPDGAFEYHMPATPRRLGAAKRKMAVAQQFIGGTAIAGIDGSADAGLEPVLPRSDHKWRSERKRHAFGELRYRLCHGGAGNSDGEFIAAQTRHDPGTGNLGLQPLGHGTQHAIAAGVPEHVVDLLKSVEANDQQHHLTGALLGVENHHRQAIVKRITVGESGKRIVFRQIPDALGFAFPHRDVAQDRAVLKAIGAPPTGETGLHGKYLAVLSQPVELHYQPPWLLRSGTGGFKGRGRTRRSLGGRGANRIERASDHFIGLVAENRNRPGVPHRDPMVGIGTHQAIAQRHRDALKAVFGNPPQQVAEVDFVECDGGHIDCNRSQEQRGIENKGQPCLHQNGDGFGGRSHSDQNHHPDACGKAAPREHHDQRNDA